MKTPGLGDFVIERMKLDAATGRDLTDWRRMVERILHPKSNLTVAVVGKYVELRDAYLSVKEALIHAGAAYDTEVDIVWVAVGVDRRQQRGGQLRGVDAIVVPGGFGERGIEGKVAAARYARENNVPYLGLCLGMQVMVVEAARTALGTDAVNSTEFDPETPNPVISLLSEQQGIDDKGGTMRLGAYVCLLAPGSKAQAAYGMDEVRERHRHRYEFNNAYRESLEAFGLFASGTLAGRHPGRGLRDPRPSLHGRHAVPPRAALATGPAAPRCSRSWSASPASAPAPRTAKPSPSRRWPAGSLRWDMRSKSGA